MVQAALRRIERLVSQVPQIDLPQEGVGFPHPAEDSDRHKPKRNSRKNAPPGHQGEYKHGREQGGEQHKLSIAAED